VVVTPKTFGFVIEVQYENNNKKAKAKVSKDKVATIDIGLNCLVAIIYNQNRPILVNGRIVKSINQWYNKRPCKTRLRKRYFRLENYFHHVSKFVMNLCVKHGIGCIIINRNEG
jgi:putative transposase